MPQVQDIVAPDVHYPLNGNAQSLIAAKLSQPETADALLRLLDRLDTIDTAVSGLEEIMKKLPDIASSFQEQPPLQAKYTQAMELLEKLSQPETMNSLGRLLDKMDTIETLVSLADEGIRKAPEIIESVLHESNSEPRLRTGLALLQKATDPDVMHSLTRLLDKIDSAELMMSALDEGIKKFGPIINSLETESPVGETFLSYFEIIEKLGRKEVVSNINNLLDKIENLDAVLNILDGIVQRNPALRDIDSHSIATISEMVQAILNSIESDKTILHTVQGGLDLLNMVNRILLSDKVQLIVEGLALALEKSKYDIEPIGPIGLIKMELNPDVQRAQGLLFTLLQSIGKKFEEFECKVPAPTK